MITYITYENGSLSGNSHSNIPINHRWYIEAQALVTSGDAVINPYVVDIDKLQLNTISEIRATVTSYRSQIVNGADHYQIAEWVSKGEASKRYTAGTNDTEDDALIDFEILKRGLGETRSELVDKIKANYSQLKNAAILLEVYENASIKAINDSEDEAQISTAYATIKSDGVTLIDSLLP